MKTHDYLSTPARQARVTEEIEHRPWPLPDEPWANAQTWEQLAFLHWRVDEGALRGLVPIGLELDLYDGVAWLGVTPFRLTGLRVRGTPPLPVVSSFPELNVRTYVSRDGRPGIWFFSLDCASTLAVEGAKRLYRLPYRRARMSIERRGDDVRYESARDGAVFSARYRPTGEPFPAMPGSLEHFLTERYCLYAADGSTLYRAQIHHPPWPLQSGEAAIELNTMPPAGVALPDEPPLVHYAARQDAVVWHPERLAL
jgi:uncharacterized protein YqjF (DUF2071 family)